MKNGKGGGYAGVGVLLGLLRIFRPKTNRNRASNTRTRTGATIAITEVITAPANSAVATRGFPNPAVDRVDVPRATTVVPCTSPAAPPPAITASVHFRNGLTSPTIAAVTTVPAMSAAGVAIVSKTWSIHGM